MNKTKKRLVFLAKLIIPAGLLAFIFSHVDFREVINQIINVHIGYYILSLFVGFGFQIAAGGWRWHYFLRKVYGIEIPFLRVLKHYWIGMFLGYFVPGHLGWDAYRILAMNKEKSGLLQHTTTVVLEKIVGLFSCVFLIMFSYPFVAVQITGGEEMRRVVTFLYILALSTGVIASVAVLMGKSSKILIQKLEFSIIRMASRFLKSPPEEEEHSVLLQGLKGCFSWKTGTVLWATSIFIRTCSAVGGFLALRALYQDTSVMINVFAVPMIMFLSMVPISFGGVGVREGIFIVVYGLFGISSATSLSSSYLGLIGLLLTISIGGLIMLWNNAKEGKNLE